MNSFTDNLFNFKLIQFDSKIIDNRFFFCSSSSDTGLVEFDCEESHLQVNLLKMEQRNMNSGYVRSVRCAVKSIKGIIASKRVCYFFCSK